MSRLGFRPLPTAYPVFGSILQREYDFDISAISTKGSGVTSLASTADGAANLTLTQGGASTLRAAHTERPPYSVISSDGGDSIGPNDGTDLTGGDLCFIAVARKIANPGTSHIVCTLGQISPAQVRSQIAILSSGVFRGVIRDATGSDTMDSAVNDTTMYHTIVVYNKASATAVRKTWVDGGAGVAGVRTGNVSTVHARSSIFSDFAGTSLGQSSLAYWAILKNAPTVAKINEFALILQEKCGGLPVPLAPWTTAT